MTYPAVMATKTSAPSVRSALPALLLAVLVGALVLWSAASTPAHAHDALIESDPADGATVDGSPEAITLTYSADILDVSPLVRITEDATGAATEITPVIDGPVATADLPEPLTNGDHTVQWRVVSSDGHPIEGTFTITVTGSTDPAVGPEGSDGGSAGADDDSSDAADAEGGDAADGASEEAPESSSSEQGSEGGESGSLMPWLLGGVGVLAVIGVIIAVTPWKRGARD